MLFGELIIWYLFFGGLSGGIFLIWFSFGVLAQRNPDCWLQFFRLLTRPLLIISLATLVIGCICLIQDLTLPQRLLLLFTKPTLSILSIGSFTLAAFMLCLVYLVIESLRHENLSAQGPLCSKLTKRLYHIIAIAAAVLALVTILYTGIFLASMKTVPLWTTPFVPILFLLSSLSTGIAVFIIVAVLTSKSLQQCFVQLRTFLKIDIALVLLECAALLGMYLYINNDPFTQLSLQALFLGNLAYEFWIGLLVCMILLPLSIEIFMLISRFNNEVLSVILGSSILIGGYFLRYCVVKAGIHLINLMYMNVALS